MKIYIRKIDKQCIEKQISYTKEILRDFFDDQSDHSGIHCVGKKSGEQLVVGLLLATDPRFDNSMQKILRAEGELAIGDLMVMHKTRSKYIVELIKPTDKRHDIFSSLFEKDRHVLINTDTLEDNDTTSEYDDIFNRSVYGMHIKLQNDALSDDNPHVCIGWSGMGDLFDITTKDELASKYDATWSDINPRKKGQDVGQVWRFIKEMQIGDYIVFSCGNTCHIGRITSDYYFDDTANENQHPDYTNIRDVEWLKKDIRKSDLSQALQNSLGAAMSVFGLNDYKSAIHELLKGTYVKDLVDEEGIDVIAEDVEQSYSVEELGKILSEMYNSSENKTTAIHMFGLKYAEAIMNSSASVVDIVKKSSVSDSYHTEVSKGIRIYESILKNEYGIHFAD